MITYINTHEYKQINIMFMTTTGGQQKICQNAINIPFMTKAEMPYVFFAAFCLHDNNHKNACTDRLQMFVSDDHGKSPIIFFFQQDPKGDGGGGGGYTN